MRLSWRDPSKSPNADWHDWLGRVDQARKTVDGALNAQQGPERLIQQVPQQRQPEPERRYFLGGDTRRPAYAWRWTSEPDKLEEGRSTGIGTFAPRGTTSATHAAVFDNGEWRLQITRALTPSDTNTALAFGTGSAIPIAFFAS